jgi:hypothetical protein
MITRSLVNCMSFPSVVVKPRLLHVLFAVWRCLVFFVLEFKPLTLNRLNAL